jgi:hypothetical protein
VGHARCASPVSGIVLCQSVLREYDVAQVVKRSLDLEGMKKVTKRRVRIGALGKGEQKGSR